ncbi:serine/threonine/tyrosine-interacting protein A-like [Uloborus diversus]|uniref:serine/threonine/tyrosine-interacting protein A-like n=1 Tax=Uloborus diversus TaxID=327109 RepID=UPI0024098B56|nr:serine/threonine/tyrosine-interacting protein A-like [Uloborus diversus]
MSAKKLRSAKLQEIIPGLFLGPFSCASKTKLPLLEAAGITHIVCVRHELEAEFIQPNFPEKFVYSVIDIADALTTNIIPFLPQVKHFIDSCFKHGGKVLVHGNTGISRSAALVIGYVMETKSLPYNDAFTLVQTKRVCVRPNEGFMQQLKEYEPIYKAQRTLLNGHTSKVTGECNSV